MGSTNPMKCSCKFEPNIFVTVALFLIILGCLMLAIFACQYIPPYGYTKDFEETTCVVETGYISANVCCVSTVTSIGDCPEDYVYPCANVTVGYSVDNQAYTAKLYDGHHSAAFVSGIDQCSYFHCFAQDYDNHLESAQNFINEYNSGKTIQKCYYNPTNKQVALLEIVPLSTLLHSILWPIVLILLNIAVIVGMYIYIKKVPLTLDKDDVRFHDEEATKALTAPSDTSSEYSSDLLASQQSKNNYNGFNNSPQERPTTRAGIKVDIDSMGGKSSKRNSVTTAADNKVTINVTPVQ